MSHRETKKDKLCLIQSIGTKTKLTTIVVTEEELSGSFYLSTIHCIPASTGGNRRSETSLQTRGRRARGRSKSCLQPWLACVQPEAGLAGADRTFLKF